MANEHGAGNEMVVRRPSEAGGGASDLLAEKALQSLFRDGRLEVTQTPLVEIASGHPRAVRLSVHGPADDPSLAAAPLHAMMSASEQTAFLDEAARSQALAAALLAPLLPGVPLVLDAHLASFSQLTPHVDPVPVVLVFDSREALERPAEMLRLVTAARGQGWEVGLGEVGSTAASLAAVSVVEPALVLLSRRVLEEPTSQLTVETIQATTAFSHSSGAVVAAEDVTDRATEAAAVAAGVTLACGPRYRGEPRHPQPHPTDGLLHHFAPPPPVPHHSPFELAARRHRARRATKPMLVALSQRIEAVAAPAGASTLVLAAFQTAEQFTPATRRRYRRLAQSSTLVLAAARDLHSTDVPGVSVSSLDASDPLVHEWNVLVLSPTTSVMLAASDFRTSTRAQPDREFDYILTYDRDLVAHAARSMLSRLTLRAPWLPEA